MTQDFYPQYSAVINKLAHYYGWDQPQQQCLWMVQSLCKQGQTPWQAFTYLVENCLGQSHDRQLDYLWFEALKSDIATVRAA